MSTLKSIWSNMRTLPPDIRTLCFIQFFAWCDLAQGSLALTALLTRPLPAHPRRIGWFPVLFYTSVWVSDLYKLDALAAGSTLSEEELYNDATRAGSRALFFNAAVSFVTAIFLPMLIAPFAGDNGADENVDGLNRRLRDAVAQAGLPRWLVPRVPFRWATLGMVWMISHAVFAVAMFSTLLVTTVFGANLVISGVSIVTDLALC
jgi:solute carrier family 45 protein 1/2/4